MSSIQKVFAGIWKITVSNQPTTDTWLPSDGAGVFWRREFCITSWTTM